MSIWITILLSLVSKVLMPYIVELLKKIFERTQAMPRSERTVANREVLKIVRGALRKRRGKSEYMLVMAEGDVAAELEAYLAKLEASA